ncbi:YtxH domain-containing protein [Arcobacter cryaerophilus gv. pseudocryaerophilus]
MLPVLPFLIGGALGAVAGLVLKTYYEERDDEINEKLEDGLMNIEEWLDEKLVVLDKYKDSLNLNDDENIISSTSNEHSLKKLQDMKQKVYHDSFVDFINFYKKLDNTDLGKLEFMQLEFDNSNLEEEITDETLKQNIKVTIDLLFKANNILSDIVLNLNESLKDEFDYESFDIKEQELIKEAFLLAKFIQKVCMSDDLAEDVVVKFNNIISNIQESV